MVALDGVAFFLLQFDISNTGQIFYGRKKFEIGPLVRSKRHCELRSWFNSEDIDLI